MRFRKKPVVIEAVQHVAENCDAYEWAASVWPRFDHEGPWPEKGVTIDPSTGEFLIATLEGAMIVSLNDWVIKGVQGELYPCKPDIFEATYDPVLDAAEYSDVDW